MWISQLLSNWRARAPERLALVDSAQEVSWDRLYATVHALAAELRRTTQPGARIAVISANRVEVIELYLACAVAGRIAVPVNPMLTDSEVRYILDSVEPSAGAADRAGERRFAALLPDLGVISLENLDELPPAAEDTAPPSALGEPFAILHTSATTGRPKGVVVDQRSIALNAFSWRSEVAGSAQARFLNAGPLFHGSMVIALDYLAAGATVHVLESFTPQACLKALERWRITHAFLVPSMVRLLLQAKGLDDTELSGFELLLHGAAPMPVELAEEAAKRLGVELQTIYGITEGGGPALTLGPQDRPGRTPVPGAVCIGLPMAGTCLRILDEDGQAVAAGELGEIWLSGDGLMQGYWRNPEQTAEVLRDGWLNTHDIGLVDDQGYVWSVDRRNDLILRGGQNVYPAEIEHVLRQSPLVADVAVVPAHSADWGQTPVAFLQLRPDAEPDEAALLRLCVTHLASYKRPSRFVLVDQIPRNPAGKILRKVLRDRLIPQPG
ncbi:MULTISPECIES: class I adenylate-forming enzyme family protein [unclassified Streptomyces]|uniref:AMP-binding protein n=1 Tax=Streptomyces sp. NBC_00060 TaxID=2975636 RepID=A0AAU2H8T9_9ACTN